MGGRDETEFTLVLVLYVCLARAGRAHMVLQWVDLKGLSPWMEVPTLVVQPSFEIPRFVEPLVTVFSAHLAPSPAIAPCASPRSAGPSPTGSPAVSRPS